ncbi:MAG: RDD family protein [Phycisphaerales bacterium]|nr:RDD family protein [Phycisphaerales bacterium]
MSDTQTHGWAIYTNSKDEILLVHLPPRDEDQQSQYEIVPAQAGELHAVRPLNKMPESISAIDDRIVLVFPLTSTIDGQVRRVFSGRAIPNLAGMQWGFFPVGRLDANPALEQGGELVDLCSTTESVFALLNEDDQYSLMMMGGSSWDRIELPLISEATSPRWTIHAIGDSLIAINHSSNNGVDLWALNGEDSTWNPMDWENPESFDPTTIVLDGTKDLLLINWDEEGNAVARVWSDSGLFTVADNIEIPANATLTRFESMNRLVGLSLENQDSSGADSGNDIADLKESNPIVQVWEIDLSDGSVLHAGEPVVTVPVSEAEFRFLIGMMLLIMVGVLVLVILPESPNSMEIPTGFALADPGRRMLASLLDLILIAALIGKLFDVQVIEIITLSVIVRTDTSWMVIPSMLVSAIVIMSVFETLLGATPGKFFMGIRVVKARPGPMQRIPLWAAIVRNIIKWILPPVAAMALIDPQMLHRGDRATRSLVATPIDPILNDESKGSDDSPDSSN